MKEQLIPDWPHLKGFKEKDKKQKENKKSDFDKRHHARELPMLPEDTQVCVDTPSSQVDGHVTYQASTPRLRYLQDRFDEIIDIYE